MNKYQDNQEKKKYISYLSEPVLNSELILINNSKLLKDKPELLNECHLQEIEELRQEFIKLEHQSDSGGTGLQKQKRQIRDKIRDLSSATYTNRDTTMFGDMITIIVNRIATRPQFSNYTFVDEMKSLAIEHILKYTWKFDPYRQSEISGQYASAFAYISTIAFNAFIATINSFNKEQDKAKEQFLERQKLIHGAPNQSTYGPDYSEPKRTIKLPNLEDDENALLNFLKTTTINEETEIYIPENYKINAKTYNFILKYQYNLSIRRIKGTPGA